MWKSKTYDQYLEWWDYWNSKIPQTCCFGGRVTASTAKAKRTSKIYRERVQSHLIDIRHLPEERAREKEISVELSLQDSATKIDPLAR